MAYICDKPAGSCNSCSHYRYDEDSKRKACFAKHDNAIKDNTEYKSLMRQLKRIRALERYGI